MLISSRFIAGPIAVMCFFGLAFMEIIRGHALETCAWRSFCGALGAYVIVTLAVKLINIILADAAVTHWMEQQEEQGRDHTV